jgi:hypothetical protein
MLIDSLGQRIEEGDIEDFEIETGAKLPKSYRDFLMTFNGGVPSPDTIDVPDAPDGPTDVQIFFGIGRTIESSDLRWNFSLVRDRCSGTLMVPIACDSGGNLFCFRVERGIAGEVIYCDLSAQECSSYFAASDFTEFLSKLRAFE